MQPVKLSAFLQKGLRFFGQNNLSMRFVRGISATLIGRFVYLFIRFGLPPLFLYAWGVHIYGEWLVLSSIVTYFNLADFGGQLYLGNRLTQIYANQDETQFRIVFHTGFVLFLIISATVLVGVMLGLFFVSSWSWLHIVYLSSPVVKVVMMALLLQFVFGLPQGLLFAVYRATKRLPLAVMFDNLLLLLTLVVTSIALALKLSIAMVAFIQIIPYLLIISILFWDLSRRYPFLQVFTFWKEADYSLILTFIKPSIDFLWIRLAQAFLVQGMVIVVGIILGSVQVVIFSTLRTMISLVRQLFELLGNTLWPDLTRLDEQKEYAKLAQAFLFLLRTSMVLAIGSTLFLYFFGTWLYHFWLHGKVTFEPRLLNWFLIYSVEMVFWSVCNLFLMAVSRHRILSKIFLISVTFSIIFASLFGHYWGLVGIVQGMFLADILLPFWCFPYLMYRYYPTIFKPLFFIRELIPVIIITPLCMLFPWLMIPSGALLLIWWLRIFRSRAITA